LLHPALSLSRDIMVILPWRQFLKVEKVWILRRIRIFSLYESIDHINRHMSMLLDAWPSYDHLFLLWSTWIIFPVLELYMTNSCYSIWGIHKLLESFQIWKLISSSNKFRYGQKIPSNSRVIETFSILEDSPTGKL
jgi:hypothetical protein